MKMLTKLLEFSVTVTLIKIVTESSAQYTYEVYEAYPQLNGQYQLYKTQDTQQLHSARPQQTHTTYNRDPYQYYQTPHQPQYQYQTVQRPQQQYQTVKQPQQQYQTVKQPQQHYHTVQQPQQQYKQHTYTQNTNAQSSVTEAEWVCMNPKTNDVMIIAVDDGPGSRNNGPPQWHQVHPQNNQPNNVQPQPTFGDPTYTQQNSIYATTERTENPVRPNNYQPTKPPANPTGTFTTTERSPIWPSNEDTATKKTISTTAHQPFGPVQGFTVEDAPTTRRPFVNNPFFDLTTQKPETTSSVFHPDDDDEPIEIVMGK